MRVAVAGSSGVIGTALVTRLQSNGHEVLRLVRRSPRHATEVHYEPSEHRIDPQALDGVDAVVNLAGAGVGDKRWTDAYKKVILDSRVDSTRTLVDACASASTPPRVLVNASAQGFYGDRGDETLDESSTPGDGFLAEVCRAWEAEAARVSEVTGGATRVAMIRTGLVMSGSGGAFGRMLPLLKLGVAGPLGNGKQWWSWITLDDHVAAIEHLLTADVSGPVNLGAPRPERQADLMKALGRAFHRPALVPAPAFALRVALGEFATDVLASTRMAPSVLQGSGFTFRHTAIDSAAEWLTRQD